MSRIYNSNNNTKRDLVQEAATRAKSLQLDEIHQIKAAWDKFDLNGDGVVKSSEVQEFLAQLNIKVPDSQKNKILNELDRNGNGTIEFIEFVLAYERKFFVGL